MDIAEPSAPVVAGGAVLLIAAFIARELAAGLLRAAGGDAWAWVKRKMGR